MKYMLILASNPADEPTPDSESFGAYMGEWAAAFGRQEATHDGPFMGIAATGKRNEIRYMDFWKVEDGKIADNWVMVDFPHVLRQLGVDVFQGQGWEAYDEGRKRPPRPEAAE